MNTPANRMAIASCSTLDCSMRVSVRRTADERTVALHVHRVLGASRSCCVGARIRAVGWESRSKVFAANGVYRSMLAW